MLFRLGANPPDMSSPCVVEENSNNSYSTHPVVGRSGQILWIRGLTRLQTQVGAPRHPPSYRGVKPLPYSTLLYNTVQNLALQGVKEYSTRGRVMSRCACWARCDPPF